MKIENGPLVNFNGALGEWILKGLDVLINTVNSTNVCVDKYWESAQT